jgi:4'-phosphopantetheinyl transferase
MIEVWDVALDTADAAVLSADERERAARFHFERDRDRFIAGRSSLRRILAGYLALDPATLVFEYNRFGKPALAGATGLHFNASHSEGRMLVAVAGREVGVDLERERPGVGFDTIVQRYFPGTPPGEFFRAWARREAYLKAIGRGLAELSEPMQEGWWVEDLDAGPGWAAAVAAWGERRRIERRVFET